MQSKEVTSFSGSPCKIRVIRDNCIRYSLYYVVCSILFTQLRVFYCSFSVFYFCTTSLV